MARGELVDYGTLDTVIKCRKCGEEIWFIGAELESESYRAYVKDCIDAFEEIHECHEPEPTQQR